MSAAAKDRWRAVVDRAKCTLCEVCAARCPTEALSMSRDDGFLSLVFRQAPCHGCDHRPPCEILCPEKALVMKSGGPAVKSAAVLARGKLARCVDCGAPYASLKKAGVLRRKKGSKARRKADRHCPACRQKILMRNFIP